MIFALLAIASALAIALGAREAFRYRLLMSNLGPLTTVAAFGALLAWFGVIIWGFVSLGSISAVLLIVIPFLLGNIARVTLQRAFSGAGLLSAESQGRDSLERQLAAERAATAIALAPLRPTVMRHGIEPGDFAILYEKVRALGIDHERAMAAMIRPDVVEWYFANVGREDTFSLDQSLQFITLIGQPGSRS